MASAVEPHSADEAGGEAVFTSDGLPSLAAPLPPPPLPSVASAPSGGDADNDAVVVEDPPDPREAFEAYASAADGLTVAGRGWASISPDADAAALSSAGIVAEDPRRRLVRLRAEVDRLEADLATEECRTGRKVDGGDTVAAAAELKSRLAALAGDDVGSDLATMLRGRQEDLSRVIARDLGKIGTIGEGGGGGDDLAEAIKNLTLSGGGSKGRIVYELFRDGGAPSAQSAVPREARFEERLRRLESALGGGAGGDKSIAERVEEAERLAGEADPRRVDALAAKAKVIRADLEAAARARSKLASRPGAKDKEDAKMIAALHAQLIDLEGMSSHLPSLVARLAELSGLHAGAADFASRLGAAEEAVKRGEGEVKSAEEILSRMEEGWKMNMAAVEQNVNRLDELLAKSGC